MKDNQVVTNTLGHRLVLFIIFFICGLSVFFTNMTFTPLFSKNIGLIFKISLVIIFFCTTIFLYRNKNLQKFWYIFFAFFIASFALLLTSIIGHWGLYLFNLDVNTPNGIAVAKFSESIMIILSIIILTKISGGDMPSIFLAKGKLKPGLIIGLIGFIGLTALSIFQTVGQNINLERVISFTPWILIFVFANGFMEELLFRGLFLKKFVSFLGAKLSNFLTAIIFTLAHMQVQYTPDLLIFLVITFFFALTWGYIMQKTDSLLGAALFHAGADMLVILGIFANYGIK